MTTASQNLFTINGVISTNKTVWQNLDSLAIACNSFITYDINQGKWCVVINKTGNSVASFNDTNIIGGINISGTGLTSFYNQVQVNFPHKDLIGQTDTVIATLDQNYWYPNEQPNILNITTDLTNDPVQAEVIGIAQLKQSRVDTVIQFQTDFSKLGLKAGEIIDVTNSEYGYTNKLFRVITVEEIDNDSGSINLNITALAYDSNVYDFTTVSRQLRTPVTGIITKASNTAIQSNNVSGSLARIFLPSLLLYGANKLWDYLFPSTKKAIADAIMKTPTVTVTAADTVCEGNSVTVNVSMCCPACVNLTGVTVGYKITGIASSFLGVPKTGNITLNSTGNGSLVIPIINNNIVDGNKTMTIEIEGVTKTITVKDRSTLVVTANHDSIVEGQSVVVTFTVTGVADGSKPYTITGSTSQVTTPLTGNVNIAGGTGTLTINTADQDAGADHIITVNLDADTFYCARTTKNITITYTGTPTPPPQPDTSCNRVLVPYGWCPTYEGGTGKVKELTPTGYVSVEGNISGLPTVTVPLTVSVTKGSPSTVTVLTTATVNASTNKPGVSVDVITSFSSIPANGIVTGSLTTIKGVTV